VIGHVPGAGILRDSQKWIAPYVVLSAAGAGLLVDRFVPRRGAVALALLPVLALPTLAWGLSGLWRLASYPSDWSTVAQRLDAAGAASGRTVVLPWSSYRRFAWAHGRAVLDPSFRFFPGQVLTSDDLRIDDHVTVAGESSAGRQVDRALAAGDLGTALARLHVGWVVVEKNTPGSAAVPEVTGRVLYDGPELRLVDVSGAGSSPVPAAAAHRALIYTVDVLTLVATAGVVAASVITRRRRPPILATAGSSEG
jgi:hypothetical protein